MPIWTRKSNDDLGAPIQWTATSHFDLPGSCIVIRAARQAYNDLHMYEEHIGPLNGQGSSQAIAHLHFLSRLSKISGKSSHPLNFCSVFTSSNHQVFEHRVRHSSQFLHISMTASLSEILQHVSYNDHLEVKSEVLLERTCGACMMVLIQRFSSAVNIYSS